MNLQLFGLDFPPLYGEETAVEIIDKIAKVDLAINELFIKREAYVTALKETIKKADTIKA